MSEIAAAYRCALRRDFIVFYEKCFSLLEPGIVFRDNWHIHAIGEALRRIEAGETTRSIINVPPRSGKSTLISIAFTAWLLGRNPRLKIICVSYSESLAKAHAAAFRNIVKSDWYKSAFPAFVIARGGDRSVETITTQHGFRYAVSISGPVMGRGADIIIADDAMSPAGAFSEAVRLRELNLWDTAHRPRLNDKTRGAIILVSQRLHENDLVGHVLASGDWEHLVIPAIAKALTSCKVGCARVYERKADEVLDAHREPVETLDEMRRAIGSMQFSAQYQQNPLPPGGNVIHREWLKFFRAEPRAFEVLVSTWDTASTLAETSSYSVGMLWGSVGTDYYLLEMVRDRWEAPDLRHKIVECQRRWEPDVLLIEDTELGRSLAQDLRRTEQIRAHLRRPRFDKKARLLAQAARFEAGQVHVREAAHWTAAFVEELLAFPNGKSDDQVDATSQALDYFTSLLPRNAPIVRRNIPRRDFVRQ